MEKDSSSGPRERIIGLGDSESEDEIEQQEIGNQNFNNPRPTFGANEV